MKKYYSDETKNQIVWEYLNGKSISEIHTETGISRSTIYIWIESQKVSFTKTEKINLRDYRELVEVIFTLLSFISLTSYENIYQL